MFGWRCWRGWDRMEVLGGGAGHRVPMRCGRGCGQCRQRRRLRRRRRHCRCMRCGGSCRLATPGRVYAAEVARVTQRKKQGDGNE
jgi:hypothetical protein